jgi:hypothetical protein
LPILSPMKTLPHKFCDPVVHQRFSLPGPTYSPIFHGFHGGYITISPSNSHGLPTCTNYIPIRCSWYFPHISTISPLCSHPFPHEIAPFQQARRAPAPFHWRPHHWKSQPGGSVDFTHDKWKFNGFYLWKMVT